MRRYLIAAAAVAAIAAGGYQTVAVDTELPALIVTSPAQAAECRDGGGCLPFSLREMMAISGRAHDLGVRAGVQWGMAQCGKPA